ncbi:DUF465 domain-containing protein [Vibrio sp. JC009]|uniref:YdcH family protein n=1 Tax=Vibrio sp. JC009 TaxID=2912314 RepID=UPI0023AF1D03|nr:DUF465 domain-containing protein [Vibrio sp. JC009]WED21254.1 DUF465 domain-containing protein [Vibrio sp. JC009]
MIEHHSLDKDFPELAETVRNCVINDDEFRTVNDEYNRLDNELFELEQNGVPTSDESFTNLKMKRAEMKDWLYQRLVQSRSK